MSMLEKAGREKFSIKNIFKTIKYRINFIKENPTYFDPDGLLIYVGGQGSGKTLSAVNYLYKILELYPKAKIVTNVILEQYPVVTYEQFKQKFRNRMNDLLEYMGDTEMEELMYKWYIEENRVFMFLDNDDFVKYNNGQEGVIFFVDEIQLYLNSLESKNINMETVTQISQQRKQRKHIVATSQVFGRMAKPLREQFSNVVACKCIANVIQNNALIDRDSLDNDDSTSTNITGKIKRRFIWTHSPKMYKRYDTYAVIERGKFVSGEKQKQGVYGNDDRLPTDNKHVS